MPKKTKKEKIIAEYRRKLTMVSSRPELPESAMEHVPAHTPQTFVPTYTVQNALIKNDHTDSVTLDPQEFLAIKKDLLMTLVLTGGILAGQIIIWRVMG
jgi:hypothetical protein